MEQMMGAHVRILQETLEQRKLNNPRYSLRAFAKSISVPAPVLSEVIRGKRNLPKKAVERVADSLNLNTERRQEFVDSCQQKSSYLKKIINQPVVPEDSQVLDEKIHQKILIEWEYFTFLALLETKDFSIDPSWISQRIGVDESRVQEIVSDLEAAGLIKWQDGRIIKTKQHVRSTHEIPSLVVRKAHHVSLDLAKQKLESTPMTKRSFTSSTFAMNADQLAEVKNMIFEFQRKLARFTKSADGDSVYQINIQFFPTTKEND